MVLLVVWRNELLRLPLRVVNNDVSGSGRLSVEIYLWSGCLAPEVSFGEEKFRIYTLFFFFLCTEKARLMSRVLFVAVLIEFM